MTVPRRTLGFISDIQIGPWIVPQKVQSKYISVNASANNWSLDLIFSIPNTSSDVVVPAFDEFDLILFFSRWQILPIQKAINREVDAAGQNKKVYFALEEILLPLNRNSIQAQISEIRTFDSMF